MVRFLMCLFRMASHYHNWVELLTQKGKQTKYRTEDESHTIYIAIHHNSLVHSPIEKNSTSVISL